MGDPNTGDIYQDALRKTTDVGLSNEQAEHLRTLDAEGRKRELQTLAEQRDAAKPDLRTMEGALSFLNYHEPNPDTLFRHQAVNEAFQDLIRAVWNALPDGPGKTVAVRAIGRARMECNSCIANFGQ